MTVRFDYGNDIKTQNPAAPQETVGQYAVPDASSIDKIISQANQAQKVWANVPALEHAAYIAS